MWEGCKWRYRDREGEDDGRGRDGWERDNDRETHVANVIRTVEVDSIPAGWEEGLCPEAEAGLRGQAVGIGAIIRSQAYMLYGLLGER